MATNPLLDRYPYPGKFEGELNLAERLYEVSMNGGQNDELGDAETFGHYMLFTKLADGTLGDLDGIDAAILHTGSSGFVSATYYTSEVEARAAWSKLEAEYEAFEGDVQDA